MSDITQPVKKFYDAFSRRDGDAMGSCYAEEARFSDAVFPSLKGQEIRNMWKMLCGRSKDIRIEYEILAAHGDHCHVHWEAWYTFTKTGRPVHNSVTAEITVRDGLIVNHRDDFSFWRWSMQALGLAGVLLGWTPLIKGKVRREAAAGLSAFAKKSVS